MPFPSVENQFRPGNRGGPGGRGRRIEDALLARLSKEIDPDPETGARRTVADQVADMIIRSVLMGSGKFTALLLDRVSGKVRQSVEHEGELTIRVEYADRRPDATPTASEAGGNPRE
jgi:hypothetical protein